MPQLLQRSKQLFQDDNKSSNLSKHIMKIIKGNEIKFIIAVIEDGKIGICNIREEDFKDNPKLKRKENRRNRRRQEKRRRINENRRRSKKIKRRKKIEK